MKAGAGLALLLVLTGAVARPAPELGARNAPRVASQAGLSQVDPLYRIYANILDARFDQAAEQIRQGCGGSPPVACEILACVNTWWRIQMDPSDVSLDRDLRAALDHAVAAAEAWIRREPQRGEPWFYLGAAYAVRVQFRALRGERLAAARDGKRIKDALERCLALDPSIKDAYFGIGLYHYYADVAPTALKFLRFLLLLPGGNRAQGLNEMVQAREGGQLLRGEADYQMHLLYLWYENQPARAMSLLRELRAHYPHNPLFLARIGEVEDVYFHDPAASLASYDSLLKEARAGHVGVPDIAEVWAQIGVAAQLDALCETDRAIDHLKTIVDERPGTPRDGMARAAFALGKAYDRLGDRVHAIEAYRQAMAAPQPGDDSIRAAANDRLRHAPDPRKTEAYRLSLAGWRLFERGDRAESITTLERSLDLNRSDAVAHFRLGRALQARDADDPRALAELEIATRSRPAAPAPIRAAAYYEAGRVLESLGDRTRALEMYLAVDGVAGAEARTRDDAAKSVARLRKSPRAVRHTARNE